MKKTLFFLIVVLSVTLFNTMEVSAISAAKDWKWCFTEVRDGEGNILAQNTGLTADPLIVNIRPDQYNFRVYGSFFNKQELTSGNIDFAGLRTSAEKIGEGYYGFSNSYALSVADPSALDNRLPLAANQDHSPFLFFDAYLKDINTPASIGTYRAYSSAIDIYDLTEPLNQFGNRTLYGRQSMNEIRWNVAPEPASMLLFGIGGAAMALSRKKKKFP